ncbi:MAG: hypothetical protein COT17_05740 [Elusimicrobia bacterium CG08_land_8_20_14_0_20_51_18]|nr:MAG: hypothetical protein COT17_05740 [Elusimicrobia bacterium CG08_land_8_20_14_0_20_51_18]
MNDENTRAYITEFIRLFIILISLYLINNFLFFLPFISGLSAFNGMPLPSLLSLVISLLAFFVLAEYSSRTRGYVENIFKGIPQAGKLYSFSIYVLLALFLYYAAYGAVFAFAGEDWVWAYQSFFIGVILYLICKIGLHIYFNSSAISGNLIEFFSNIPKKL